MRLQRHLEGVLRFVKAHMKLHRTVGLVVVAMLAAVPAEAGRWKIGYGKCYWDANDSGPNQCSPGRWKVNNGCWFVVNDTGPDQCVPPPQTTPYTVYVSQDGWTGYVTFQELDGYGSTVDGVLSLRSTSAVLDVHFKVYPDGTPSILSSSFTRNTSGTLAWCEPQKRWHEGVDCCDRNGMWGHDLGKWREALRIAYRTSVGGILRRPIPLSVLQLFAATFAGSVALEATWQVWDCAPW